jgi:hypothetical protein
MHASAIWHILRAELQDPPSAVTNLPKFPHPTAERRWALGLEQGSLSIRHGACWRHPPVRSG